MSKKTAVQKAFDEMRGAVKKALRPKTRRERLLADHKKLEVRLRRYNELFRQNGWK